MLTYLGSLTQYYGLCEIIEPGDPDYIPSLYKQGRYQVRLVEGICLQRVRPESLYIS